MTSKEIKKVIKRIVPEIDARSCNSHLYWAGLLLLGSLESQNIEEILRFYNFTEPLRGRNKARVKLLRKLHQRAVEIGILVPDKEQWDCDWLGYLDQPIEFSISLLLDMMAITDQITRLKKEDGEIAYEKNTKETA